MAKGSPSKRHKFVLAESKSEEVDRISSLPDELLCHILSFLQTKEVVATSVLSIRWRSVWTLVLALDFEDNWTCFSKTSFAYVVCKVFDQHKAKCIKRLCVSSYNKRCNPEFVSTLLSIALKKNLEELDLFFYSRLEASLPSMLFTCQTISVLKLDGTINLNLPSSVHFPLLKILHLYALYFADDEPITRLLSGCPVLEELCYLEVKIDRICVPSLKKLHVKSKLERLQIDTPLLEHLQIQDTSVTDYSVENLHNLVEAHVDIYFEQDKKKKIPNLFNGIHKIKFLSLSTCATEVLSYACLEFPEFHNLVHLQFSIITLDSYFLVGQLLEKCPKLEVLDIEKVYEDGEIEWTQPTITVPSCLSSHLTVFKFRKYGGSQEELELVEYILVNAKVLKIETIQIASWLKSEEIRCAIARLSALPRASKDCRTHYLTLD